MSNKSEAFEAVLNSVWSSTLTGRKLRDFAMDLVGGLKGYDWSGVYVLGGTSLNLDAYCGAATEHTKIKVGQGVCGTAVAENRNQIVKDVRNLENYLSCSLETRSEIVVLIRRDDEILGQIDIDGHKVGEFSREDEEFLEELAEIFAERWE